MTFTQTQGLRDREYAKFEAVQAGSKVAIAVKGNYDSIKKYIFSPTDLISTTGSLTAYSDYALNGVIKRISVNIGNWTATGSLWMKESGADFQHELLQMISGTNELGSKKPIYPGEYPSYTASGTTNYTAVQIGSPNTMFPLIITEKVLIQGSGLGTGKSGLGIVIEYI